MGMLDGMIQSLKDLRDRKLDEAEEIVRVTMEDGKLQTQINLLDAHTRTGRQRETERGGLPGRFETGNMVGSVGDDVQRSRTQIVGAFGWFASDFEAYFKQQDLGFEKIPPAYALPHAGTVANVRLRRRLNAWQYDKVADL